MASVVVVVVGLVAFAGSRGQGKPPTVGSAASQAAASRTAPADPPTTPAPAAPPLTPTVRAPRPTATAAPPAPSPAPAPPAFPTELVGGWSGPAELAGLPVTVRMTVAQAARGQSVGPYSVQLGQATCHFTTTLIDYGRDFVSFSAQGGEHGCADGRVSLRFTSPGVADYAWAGPSGTSSHGTLRHG